MSKSFLSIVVLLVAQGLVSGSSYAQDTVELSLNLAIPPTHKRWERAIKPWIDEIESKTNGRVKIVPYFAQALSKQAENFDSVAKGIADMGEAPLDRKPGRFPIIESIFNISKPSKVIKNGSRMLMDFVNSDPAVAAELKDVKVLFLHLSSPFHIGMATKPITTLDDFRGVKVGVSGNAYLAQKLESLGSTVVGIQLPDVYLSMEKGVIDGYGMCVYTLMVDRKWGEVFHHMTPVTFGYSVFSMAMNWNTWNKLPEDVKKVFDDVNNNFALDTFDKFWWDSGLLAKEEFEGSMGGTTHLLSDSDIEAVDELSNRVEASWVKQMKEKGYDSDTLLQKFRDAENSHGVKLSDAYQ